MNEKIIKVFYDRNGLPYKDKALTVHYPLIGNGFLGSSNDTKIRFYYSKIGRTTNTYQAVSKTPSGKQGSEVLSVKSSDEDGYYAELSLSQWYFQEKGDVLIALKVYRGGCTITTDPETGFQVVDGEPVIQTTGSIKLGVNYAPIGSVPDFEDNFTTYYDILALMGDKADTDQVPLLIDLSQFSTYQELYDVVGTRPFIAPYRDSYSICKFGVSNPPLFDKHYLLINSSYGLYETGELTMTNSISFEEVVKTIIVGVDTNVFLYETSGTLADLDKSKLQKSNASISYDDKEYLPYYWSNSYNSRTFANIETQVNTSQGTISFVERLINVNFVDKTYSMTTNTKVAYTKTQVDENFAKLDTQNVFTYSPQTNEVITDESADTKLSTKKYVKDVMNEHLGDYSILNGKVSAIESKIPSEASSSNKLADKDFVNSTVNSLAAFYITKNAQGDPFATLAELQSATVFYSGGQVRVPTRNDYCMVNADETHDDASCRYIYQGTQWEFQFVVNETPFTADQLAAINSGITQALVGQITTNALAITSINSKLPKIKDFAIPTSAWQLDSVSGKYYAELNAGNDFIIDDNFMKNYTGTSNADNSLIMMYGIIASSNANTQKFKFECLLGDSAPDEIVNYTISMYGGN